MIFALAICALLGGLATTLVCWITTTSLGIVSSGILISLIAAITIFLCLLVVDAVF